MNAVHALSEDQRDCLQEIVNVAMGQAGDSLARYLETFIQLSVPKIRLVDSSELVPELQKMSEGAEFISAVRQGFFTAKGNAQIRGEAIVVFGDESFHELADLLAYDGELSTQDKTELLLEVANILSSACLIGLAEQMDVELGFSPPSVIGQNITIHQVVNADQLNWSRALFVEIKYTLEQRSFNCSLLLMMPGEAIDAVTATLDLLLAD